MEIKQMDIGSVVPYENNPRNNKDAVEATANSIQEFGWQQPIVVDKNNMIIVGHTRKLAADKLGLKTLPVVVADNLTDEQAKAYRLADNKTGELADWDLPLLNDELDELNEMDLSFNMSDFGFGDGDTFQTTKEKIADNDYSQSLAESFGVVPFSFLDSRKSEWQERKKQWKSLGITSEVGRDQNLIFAKSMNVGSLSGTSIFDPVLCELCYHWFMPDKKHGSKIYDCFAGGSVRGVVASIMGYDYFGIDLRDEQVKANQENARQIGVKNAQWVADDSLNVDQYLKDESQDMVFTCPPYADLEVYSDDDRDISNMDYQQFVGTYQKIIEHAVNKLKPNRFAIVTISDVRDKKGFYHDLQSATTQAMENAGAYLYNDMVLINANGSGGMRARRNMRNRKTVRSHQNVLVYFKGNPKEIQSEFSELHDINDVLEAYEDAEEI